MLVTLFVTLKLIIAKVFSIVGGRAFLMLTIAGPIVPLERLFPYHPGQKMFRPKLFMDLLHFFIGGFLTLAMMKLTYMFFPIIFAWAGEHAHVISVKNLPWWGQLLAFEIGWTFTGYWLHRALHAWPFLWRLHAVHESSRQLDWVSGFRIHPLEPFLFQVLTIMPLWFLQMSLPVAEFYVIWTYVWTHVQHSNVRFPIGPLKYILPSADFHHWHHARNLGPNGEKLWDVPNYSQYPIWDVIFGTFHMPKERPTDYGYADDVPLNYTEQLLYPFGLHHLVVRWREAFRRRNPRLIAWWEGVEARFVPAHQIVEAGLAKISLLPPDPPPAARPAAIPEAAE